MAASGTKRRHKVRRRADMSLLGGIRPPIAVLSALLLSLTALTALSLGRVGHDAIPEAVLTSQQHFAEDGAVAMRASLDESVTDLNRAAALLNSGTPVSADSVLDRIGSVYQKWHGTAVIEIRSGRLLAARGENVPLTAVDRGKLSEPGGLDPRMVRLANGETRLLSFALLSWPGQPQQLLVASRNLRFPGISLGGSRAIAVIDSEGTVLGGDGLPETGRSPSSAQREKAERARKQLDAFAEIAAGKARQHPLEAKEPGAGGFPGISGSLVGGARDGGRTAARLRHARRAPARREHRRQRPRPDGRRHGGRPRGARAREGLPPGHRRGRSPAGHRRARGGPAAGSRAASADPALPGEPQAHPGRPPAAGERTGVRGGGTDRRGAGAAEAPTRRRVR
ncbi:hypothetical protein LUX05_08810 [Streptomyces somaliensis]|nr:hypothetical protein [Streptomyces somaliensis]